MTRKKPSKRPRKNVTTGRIPVHYISPNTTHVVECEVLEGNIPGGVVYGDDDNTASAAFEAALVLMPLSGEVAVVERTRPYFWIGDPNPGNWFVSPNYDYAFRHEHELACFAESASRKVRTTRRA